MPYSRADSFKSRQQLTNIMPGSNVLCPVSSNSDRRVLNMGSVLN